jgi:hypothetical protein
MEWLIPYKLESDEARTGRQQETSPRAAEPCLEESAPTWVEDSGGLMARACMAIAEIWRRLPCSRS